MSTTEVSLKSIFNLIVCQKVNNFTSPTWKSVGVRILLFQFCNIIRN